MWTTPPPAIKTFRERLTERLAELLHGAEHIHPLLRPRWRHKASEVEHILDLFDECIDGQKEVCICAAVRTPEGVIVRGHRHADALRAAERMSLSYDHSPGNHGFITSHNRYVDRAEGLRLQLAAGVPSANPSGYGLQLYSDDLY